MPGKSQGYALSIGLQDAASAGLDAINKRIAALTAPADRFNKSVAKFGEVTGINRAAEGMQTLGDRALGAARSVERLAGPMAGITSAASLAGLAELEKKWSTAGNQISKTANLLNTPVSTLSRYRLAARAAGSSAEAMDASLAGLNHTFESATWSKDDSQIAVLNRLQVGFGELGKTAKISADGMGDVAEAVSSFKDPRDQADLLGKLGISADLLPMLNKGRAGLQKFLDEADGTGAVWTKSMVDNSLKVEHAWTHMEEVAEGAGMKIADHWSGTATKVLDSMSAMIKRGEELAASYPKTAKAAEVAAFGLGGLRIAPWVLRGLGWLLVGESAAGATVIAPIVALTAATYLNAANTATTSEAAAAQGYTEADGFDDNGMPTSYTNPKTGDTKNWMRFDPRYAGAVAGAPAVGAPPYTGGGRSSAQSDAAAQESLKFWMDKGLPDYQAAGMAAQEMAESKGDPNARGDYVNGVPTAHGGYQWHETRRRRILAKTGIDVSTADIQHQREAAYWELTHTEPEAYRRLLGASTPGQAGAAATEFERPDPNRRTIIDTERGQDAERILRLRPRDGDPAVASNGPSSIGEHSRVEVHIHHHNPPPGTTSSVVATGAVNVAPLLVHISMPPM